MSTWSFLYLNLAKTNGLLLSPELPRLIVYPDGRTRSRFDRACDEGVEIRVVKTKRKEG